MVIIDVDAKTLTNLIHDSKRGGNDFGANAVTSNNSDIIFIFFHYYSALKVEVNLH